MQKIKVSAFLIENQRNNRLKNYRFISRILQQYDVRLKQHSCDLWTQSVSVEKEKQ